MGSSEPGAVLMPQEWNGHHRDHARSRTMMRPSRGRQRSYCGVDLHARTSTRGDEDAPSTAGSFEVSRVPQPRDGARRYLDTCRAGVGRRAGTPRCGKRLGSTDEDAEMELAPDAGGREGRRRAYRLSAGPMPRLRPPPPGHRVDRRAGDAPRSESRRTRRAIRHVADGSTAARSSSCSPTTPLGVVCATAIGARTGELALMIAQCGSWSGGRAVRRARP